MRSWLRVQTIVFAIGATSILFSMHGISGAAEPEIRITSGQAELTAADAERRALHDAFRKAIEAAVGVQIVSETRVKDATVLEDKIFANADGFVEKWEILNRGRSMDFLTLEVKSWIRSGRLNKALLLNGLDVRKVYDWVGHPRVVFIIDEVIDNQPSPMEVVRSRLEETFRERGLFVLDAGQMKKLQQRDADLLIRDPEQAKIVGNMLGAEIVVAGKCVAQLSRKIAIGGFTQNFYSAYFQVRAYQTATAEILHSGNYQHNREKDLSAMGPMDAAMNAVNSCIDDARNDILFKIVRNWYDAFSNPQSYFLLISDLPYEKMQTLRQEIYNLNPTRDVQVRAFEASLSEIELRYEGNQADLIDHVLRLSVPLQVLREDRNRISLKVKQP